MLTIIKENAEMECVKIQSWLVVLYAFFYAYIYLFMYLFSKMQKREKLKMELEMTVSMVNAYTHNAKFCRCCPPAFNFHLLVC